MGSKLQEINKAYIDDYIKKAFKNPDFEKIVRNIIADSLADMYKALWQKKNSWVGDIKK